MHPRNYVRKIGESQGWWLDYELTYFPCADEGRNTPLAGVRTQPQEQGEGKPWWRGYLLYDDICVGPATLVRRDEALRYLVLIEGSVVYADDNIYRIMAADHIPMLWHDEPSVLYEYGGGVSTSGSDVWKKRIDHDWRATDQVIQTRLNGRERKLFSIVSTLHGRRDWTSRLRRLLSVPGRLTFRLRLKFRPRLAPDSCDEGYLELLEATAETPGATRG